MSGRQCGVSLKLAWLVSLLGAAAEVPGQPQGPPASAQVLTVQDRDRPGARPAWIYRDYPGCESCCSTGQCQGGSGSSPMQCCHLGGPWQCCPNYYGGRSYQCGTRSYYMAGAPRVYCIPRGLAHQTVDVTVDVSKLTKFTTSFTLKTDNVKEAASRVDYDFRHDPEKLQAMLNSKLIVNGKLIADVPGETMKLRLDLSAKLDLSPEPDMPPVQVKHTYLLTFDGPTGYVALEGYGIIQGPMDTKLEFKGCMKYKFNPDMIPPPALVKQMIDQKTPMIRAGANQIPHKVKDGLAYYGDGVEEPLVALRISDGTPAAIWILPRTRSSMSVGIPDFPAAVEFSKFTAFEPFSEVQCVDAPSAMLDDPYAQVALFLSEQLFTHLQLAAPLSPVTHHVFAQLPRVLRGLDHEKTCVLPTEAASKATARVEPFAFFGFVAAGVASAAVGVGIAVFGTRRAFNKPEAGYTAIS